MATISSALWRRPASSREVSPAPVIDGGSRDFAELQADAFKDFPGLTKFFHATTTAWVGVEFNTPVRIGTATVLPGDVIVGEDEGVLFFPPEMLDAVLKSASEAEGAKPISVSFCSVRNTGSATYIRCRRH